MSTIGELNVKITADNSDYLRKISEVQNQTNKIMGSVSNTMNTVKKTVATALGVTAIYKFGKSCIQLGSDLKGFNNVVNSVFSNMSDSVDKFSKSAMTNFGLSEAMAKKYIGAYGAMANSFGYTEQEAYKMSTTLAGLAGDVASFYNISSDDAFVKLKSVFSGETETLKDIGVVMTENALNSYLQAQGIDTVIGKMTEQEKVAIRYKFILDQLSLAQGNFANNSDNWGNQVRVLTLRFEQFKATIGQGLINIFLPIVKVLNVVISKLQVFAQYFSSITEVLFGKAIKTATKVNNTLGKSLGNVGTSGANASKGLDKASKATKNTGKEAKKAKKELLGLVGGLDEINNLTSKSTQGVNGSGSSGGVGGIVDIGGIGDIDLGSGIDTSILSTNVEKVKKIFSNLKEWLLKYKDVIISIVAGLVSGIASYFVISKWGVISKTVTTAIKPISNSIKMLKETFIACKTFGVTPILKTFFGINPVAIAVSVAIGIVVGALVYLWRTNEDFRKNVIKAWEAIKKALSPWLEAFKELFLLLADIIGTVLVGAFKVLSKIVIKVVKFLADRLLKRIQKYCPYVESLGEAFLEVVKGLRKLWDKVKEFDFIGWVKGLVEPVKENVKEIVDGFTELKEGIAEKWQEIKDSTKDFVINIKSKVENFKDKASTIWGTVKTWVKDKVISIASKVSNFKDKANDIWTEVKSWVKDKTISIASKVGDFYDKAKTNYDTAKEKIKTWAFSVSAKVGDFYSKVKSNYNSTKEKIKSFVFSISVKVGDFYSKVKTNYNTAKEKIKTWAFAISAKVSSFYDKVKANYNSAKEKIKTWVFSIGTKVSSFYNKVKSSYNTAKEKIKSWVFSIGAKVGSFYDKVKSAYNSTKKSIKTWAFTVSLKVNASANSVKGVINGIIKQINSSVLGKIKFTVPSWIPAFGGKSWSAPKIPLLARGGVLDSATLSVIGEAGKEAVLPLENNTGAISLIANKLLDGMSTSKLSSLAMSNNSSASQNIENYNGDVIIKLDGNTVFRQSVVSILRQMKRQGITI